MARGNARPHRIPLYDIHGLYLTTVGRTEATKLRGTEEAQLRCYHCSTSDEAKKRCMGEARPHRMVLMATALYKNTHVSNTSITFSEVMAYAGLDERRGFTEQVRRKIEAWPFVGDTLAPRVCPVGA